MYTQNTLGAVPVSVDVMRNDVRRFLASGAKGVRWAGGVLSNVPSGALYESLDGFNGATVFNADSDFDSLASSNPGIAREWYASYGFVPAARVWYFGPDIIRSVTDMQSWRVKPGTPGTGWTAMDGQYNYVARKDIVDAWGGPLPAGSFVDTAPNGNLIVRTPSGQKPPQPAFVATTNPTAPLQAPSPSYAFQPSLPVVDSRVDSPPFITTTAPPVETSVPVTPAQAAPAVSKAAIIAALLALFIS